MKATKPQLSNGFNRSVVLRWRGICYSSCTATWVGDPIQRFRILSPDVKVTTVDTERRCVSEVVPKGTVHVSWPQFCVILRDAGIKVRRMCLSSYRDSAVCSTVIK